MRKFVKSRPHTICMTHMSHVYPQGANLYWIFITRMHDPAEFKAYHAGILDAIQKSGASMSHHHGIGKMFAPWLEGLSVITNTKSSAPSRSTLIRTAS